MTNEASETHHHHLDWLPDRFMIHRWTAASEVPNEILNAQPVFIARTDAELSILCPANLATSGDKTQGPYRGLRVVGELEFDLVGVISRITSVLAQAKISVLTVSTFNTDYVFVSEVLAEPAEEALRGAGYRVT